jgi:shikimate kinase
MMGQAKTMGAISVVNAIACGKGGSLAVKLPTFANVEVKEKQGGWLVALNGRRLNSPLAVQTVQRAIRKLGEDPRAYSGSINTTTSVPIGVGLKTSSSSSTAIALATFSAFGKSSYEVQDVLECSASASLAAGASVTGAIDDAASCLLGGANFADNSTKRILSSIHLGNPMTVLIRVPPIKSRRTLAGLNYVRKFSKIAESIFTMGREGRIWKAMTLNGLLYCSIYGYQPSDSLEALEEGALGASLSGTGPAVAAVLDGHDGSEKLAELWKEGGAKVIRTETTDRGATIGS